MLSVIINFPHYRDIILREDCASSDIRSNDLGSTIPEART